VRTTGSEQDKQRNSVEFSVLTTHLMWAESVANDSSELEKIIRLLESNPFLRRYERWRKRSQAD